MSFSQSHQWSNCCQHQEEVAILQEKLMEIHNKLLDQLDVCREQQLNIIELNKQLVHQHSSNQNQTFNYQSFGQHSQQYQYHQQNRSPHFSGSNNHDSRQSHQTKNDLLQADLQAMRNKVLAQITEKNRLKEQIKELKCIQKKQLAYQTKKCEGLQSILQKLQEQHQYLKEKYEKCKASARLQPELQRISNRNIELESKLSKEKDLIKSLQVEKISLQKIIDDFERIKFRNSYEKQNKPAYSDLNVMNQQREIDSLKYQIQKLNKNIEVRQVEFKERGDERRKKRGFQQTKQLIKKLQQTQLITRKNRKALS